MAQITSRPFTVERDFMAVRRFLIDTYRAHGGAKNWTAARWETTRFLVHFEAELSGDRAWERECRIWENDSGIVGVAHPEDAGTLFLEMHPDSRAIEADMYAWALERHGEANRTGRLLYAYTLDADELTRATLNDAGFTYSGPAGYSRRRVIDAPIASVPIAPGYAVRSIDPDNPGDLAGRANVANLAFGHDLNTPERISVLMRAPSHRADLHLLAVAPDGTIAAITAAWFDEENHLVEFEPVATHPDHRRRGLASAVISEGLVRARRLGATMAYVGSGYESPANLLYERLGFVDTQLEEEWQGPPGP